jgi:hypothetical protein
VESPIAHFEIWWPSLLRKLSGWRVAPAFASLGDSEVLGIDFFSASAGKCKSRQDETLEETFERHFQLRSAE